MRPKKWDFSFLGQTLNCVVRGTRWWAEGREGTTSTHWHRGVEEVVDNIEK